MEAPGRRSPAYKKARRPSLYSKDVLTSNGDFGERAGLRRALLDWRRPGFRFRATKVGEFAVPAGKTAPGNGIGRRPSLVHEASVTKVGISRLPCKKSRPCWMAAVDYCLCIPWEMSPLFVGVGIASAAGPGVEKPPAARGICLFGPWE